MQAQSAADKNEHLKVLYISNDSRDNDRFEFENYESMMENRKQKKVWKKCLTQLAKYFPAEQRKQRE